MDISKISLSLILLLPMSRPDLLDTVVKVQPVLAAPWDIALNTIPFDVYGECTDDYSELRVWYFDSNGNTSMYKMNEYSSLLANPSFQQNPKFNIWCPGFSDNVSSTTTRYLRKAYSDQGIPLFVFDSCAYTCSNLNVLGSLERAVKHVCCVGKVLGRFLSSLVQGGVDVNNIHPAGHSLGGQMMACVGSEFEKVCGYKLPRLSALDPAGGCYNKANLSHQIDASDAEYVDIYNSNRKELGTVNLIGTSNFLANGEGYREKHCSEDLVDAAVIPLNLLCSHVYAVVIWAKSVRGQSFYATKCSCWDDYQSGKCNGNDVRLAGYLSSTPAQGVYYFNSNASSGANEAYSVSEKLQEIANAPLFYYP